MRKYTDPQAAGYLLEAKACEKVSKELRRLAEKYQRHVDKEQKGREAEFEAVMGYTSEDEIRDAYGWSFITEAQMERYIDIFRTGQAALEQHTPTCDELVHRILCRICREIEEEQREWKFAALSPREQAAELERARKASDEWKQHMKAIKAQLRGVSSPGDEPAEEIRT